MAIPDAQLMTDAALSSVGLLRHYIGGPSSPKIRIQLRFVTALTVCTQEAAYPPRMIEVNL